MSVLTTFLNLFKWNTGDTADLNQNFDIDKALNDNWDKIDTAVKTLNDNKVSVSGSKVLSDKNFTAAYETKLTEIATAAQVNVLESVKLNGTALLVTSKGVEIKDPEVTDARSSSIKGLTYNTLDDRLESIESDFISANNTGGHVYGIRRKISNNSSPLWERTDDSIGLIANATKNGIAVQNDFDNLSPFRDIISFNLDLTTKKKTAYHGDPNFAFDGSNGDVYTHIPTFWIKVWQKDDYDYVQIADYAKSGFTEIKEFDIARYHMGLVSEILRSYSGLQPSDYKTIVQHRTYAQALGTEFCLLDWRIFVIQLLYLVEYASFNSQDKLGNGIISMRYNSGDVALIAESNVNRFIVNTSGGNAFLLGQKISIGTAEGNNSVAHVRTITAINDYTDGTITGKVITFDGTPVNIALTSKIWSCSQPSGQCDSLGMLSGCLANDSKHSVAYRGIENPFGNLTSWIDGINIQNGQAWICYDPSQYASNIFAAPYKQLGYVNAQAGGYQKTQGFDINNTLIRFATEIGGASNTYICDEQTYAAGNMVVRSGGAANGGSAAGLFCLNLYNSSSASGWASGVRVLKYQ